MVRPVADDDGDSVVGQFGEADCRRRKRGAAVARWERLNGGKSGIYVRDYALTQSGRHQEPGGKLIRLQVS